MKMFDGEERFLFKVAIVLLIVAFSMLLMTSAMARPLASEYVTPYGVNAPWNIPVKDLPRHPQSSTYAGRFWNYSADRAGNFDLRFVNYTYPVYYVEDATTTLTVSGGNSTINGKQIPWNPDWSAAGGSDAQVIILDPATGREWNLWQASISGSTLNISNGSLVGSSERVDGSQTGDYRTKTNCWQPSRGIGCQYLMGLVQPEEVSNGVIRHALSVPIKNPSKTVYVPPATKLEHSGTEISNPIPEGMRFALDVTDAQIETYVATKPAAYQKLARAMAKALRDYGWFITDTSGSAGFQMEAVNSAGALWRAQGIDPASTTARDLMDGLISQSRIYALVPSDQYGDVTPPPDPEPEPGLCEEELASCEATNATLTNGFNAAVKRLQDQTACVEACLR